MQIVFEMTNPVSKLSMVEDIKSALMGIAILNIPYSI